MNVKVKQLTGDSIFEFVELLRLFDNVFEIRDHQIPNRDYLKELLNKPGFIVFAAFHKNAVAGGLTAHVLPSYNFESSEVYIYDLAVKTEFQRKSIGKKLLLALTQYCLQHNYREFFVQADEPDTYALEFYRSTGGIPEKAVHFNYPIDK